MVRVQATRFDPGGELAAFQARYPDAGAVVSFLGAVRATAETGESLQALVLEHYPGMCERRLAEIAAEAARRWAIQGSLIIHRVGTLLPGEEIVFTAVAASHRADAFAACAAMVDLLKTEAPFWKQERTASGQAAWLAPKAVDLARAAGCRLPAGRLND